MYFLTYEVVKKEMQAKFGSEGPKALMGTIFAGGMAGIANWAIGMPADVLKSRLQTGELQMQRTRSPTNKLYFQLPRERITECATSLRS